MLSVWNVMYFSKMITIASGQLQTLYDNNQWACRVTVSVSNCDHSMNNRPGGLAHTLHLTLDEWFKTGNRQRMCSPKTNKPKGKLSFSFYNWYKHQGGSFTVLLQSITQDLWKEMQTQNTEYTMLVF